MEKHQAEIVADTLLEPMREVQRQEVQRRLQKQNRAEAQRGRAALAMLGATCGALIGHFGTGDVWPTALVGFAAGGLVGLLWPKHV
jgi:uncharacterized protein YcfJ